MVGRAWCLREERHDKGECVESGPSRAEERQGVVASGGITYC